MRTWIIALAALLLSASGLRADTYTYTGNDFTQFSGGVTCPPDCSIDGSFTVSSPLPDSTTTDATPTAFDFSISGGDPTTWTNLNGAIIENFSVTTNSMGQITDWAIELESSGGNPDLGTFQDGDNVVFGFDVQTDTFIMADNMDGGTWTSPLAPTPEPPSLTLFLLGAVVIGMITYRARLGKNTTQGTHGFLHRA